MNHLISWISNVLVRVALTSFLVGVTFLGTVALGFGNPLQAQAVPFSSEAATYQTDRTDADNKLQRTGNEQVDNARENLKDTADNIVEKLNLDEPLPPSTKKFFNQVQDQVDKVGDNIKQTFGNDANQ